jgi:hypothetical protein
VRSSLSSPFNLNAQSDYPMSDTAIWQKSKSERAAAFAAAFAGTAPAERKIPSLTTQLRLLQPLILKKRQEGYTVEQICEKLKHPDIAVDASPVSIRRVILEAERKREQRRKARIAALMPKPSSAPSKPTAGSAMSSTVR